MLAQWGGREASELHPESAEATAQRRTGETLTMFAQLGSNRCANYNVGSDDSRAIRHPNVFVALMNEL